MDGMIAFFVPTIVFLVVVAPLWIIMHYRSKQRSQASLSEDERTQLEALGLLADKMADRIETLESILDAETPDWREKQARG